MLAKEELIRYQRQIAIENWGEETQQRVKGSTVFVAGTGGLGSPVLYYLAAAGVGNIILCDYDTIELHNLNRQILHSGERIGRKKSESAKKSLYELNSTITINAHNEKIKRGNAADLVGDADIIIDCLDNFKTRQILNRVSVRKGIPMIHAGVAEFRGQVSFLHPPETPCLACFISDNSRGMGLPIVGASAGVIGSIQAVEAIKYLTGRGSNLKNRLLFWDGLEMKFETIAISRNPRCRVCKKL